MHQGCQIFLCAIHQNGENAKEIICIWAFAFAFAFWNLYLHFAFAFWHLHLHFAFVFAFAFAFGHLAFGLLGYSHRGSMSAFFGQRQVHMHQGGQIFLRTIYQNGENTIEILELEQVSWHRSCKYFGRKNAL
jgi:hypothetical protein